MSDIYNTFEFRVAASVCSDHRADSREVWGAQNDVPSVRAYLMPVLFPGACCHLLILYLISCMV